MTCTSMTKQSNYRALTDRPGDPNVWYIITSYPHSESQNPWLGKSESEGDSIGLSQPTGWDGWHSQVITGRSAVRVGRFGAPGFTIASSRAADRLSAQRVADGARTRKEPVSRLTRINARPARIARSPRGDLLTAMSGYLACSSASKQTNC
jgi:hypothetical protein